jgi:hypothetical protein
MIGLATLIGEITEGPAHPNLWNPTILGVLVVISAIGLFCGSAYLLLSTNLGARLGFLVAFASLTGFLVLLTTLWWTSGNSGIDPPHGHSPAWSVVGIVNAPQDSTIAEVREAPSTGTLANETVLGNLRPAMDAALVRTAPIEGVTPLAQPFAKFTASLDYLTDFPGYKTYVIGGGTKNLFWHRPKYAIAEFCPTYANTPIGQAPVCDPLQPTQYAVMSFNYGSLREPVVFQFWLPSVLLFGLPILGLHWYETDIRKRKLAAKAPVPVPVPTNA